jgi:NAD(P)-dependent dehydrogenase (short-subunit alcohol dehydrogenase family)
MRRRGITPDTGITWKIFYSEAKHTMKNLKGKVAFITGAAAKRGMGHAIALRLAEEGADIIVADKVAVPVSHFPGDEGWGGLEAIAGEIKALGRQVMTATMDIVANDEVEKTVAEAVKKFGKIDILVHAAAIRGPVGVEIINMSEKEIRNVIDIDLVGAFLVCRAAAKNMVAHGEGGKIVVFCSMAGTHGVAGSGAYSAAKYGTIGLTKSLALELAKYHINVNGINPGMIVTNLRDDAFGKMAEKQGISWDDVRKKDYETVTKMIPWGRMGTPEDAADLVSFLVSKQSDYITGEVIGLGGGAT